MSNHISRDSLGGVEQQVAPAGVSSSLTLSIEGKDIPHLRYLLRNRDRYISYANRLLDFQQRGYSVWNVTAEKVAIKDAERRMIREQIKRLSFEDRQKQ